MAAGDSERPRLVGPSKVELPLLILGRAGRSKPGSSRRGEFWPDGSLKLIPGRTGGSSGSSSAMSPKRCTSELARDRVGRRRPLTGLAAPERLVVVCLARR